MKPGVFTSEFAITVLTDIGVLASALTGNLSPKWAAVATAVSTLAYSLSRGLAKQNAVPIVPVPVTASQAPGAAGTGV